jgi:transcriptional regulator with XRE-family HTH domain
VVSEGANAMMYNCPVCGYDGLTKPPTSNRICPCCGTEFESDDFDRSYKELRSEWIEKGMPWFSRATLRPKEWSAFHQLIIANFAADLVSHPRFRSDIEFRYAVNKAYSEVRIAKQLKILREDDNLTQSQLAEKAAMKQSRISALEGMDYSSWSISTLERLAKALGVGFKFSFASWSELVGEIESGLTQTNVRVPSFEDDPASRSKSELQSVFANAVTNVFKYRLPSTEITPIESYSKQPEPEPEPRTRMREKQLALVASGK